MTSESNGTLDKIRDHRDDLKALAEMDDLPASRYAEALLELEAEG